jgi:hypothetical protein
METSIGQAGRPVHSARRWNARVAEGREAFGHATTQQSALRFMRVADACSLDAALPCGRNSPSGCCCLRPRSRAGSAWYFPKPLQLRRCSLPRTTTPHLWITTSVWCVGSAGPTLDRILISLKSQVGIRQTSANFRFGLDDSRGPADPPVRVAQAPCSEGMMEHGEQQQSSRRDSIVALNVRSKESHHDATRS